MQSRAPPLGTGGRGGWLCAAHGATCCSSALRARALVRQCCLQVAVGLSSTYTALVQADLTSAKFHRILLRSMLLSWFPVVLVLSAPLSLHLFLVGDLLWEEWA